MIVAIDFGLANVGVALYPEKTTHKITTSARKETFERITYIVGKVLELLVDKDPDKTTIIIEQPFIPRRARKHLDKTFMVFGVLYWVLYIRNFTLIQVPPRVWMNDIDKRSKNNRRAWAKKRGYKIISKAKADDHTTDAACMIEWYRLNAKTIS